MVSLQTFLQKASADSDSGPAAVNRSLAQALPFDVLVRVGDTHHANSGVVAPLCNCMNLQATVCRSPLAHFISMVSASQAAASKEYRDDFVNAGAIAVPLRIFDEAPIIT